jgi:hypothetical protein
MNSLHDTEPLQGMVNPGMYERMARDRYIGRGPDAFEDWWKQHPSYSADSPILHALLGWQACANHMQDIVRFRAFSQWWNSRGKDLGLATPHEWALAGWINRKELK